jgi:hypothetical protein
MKRDDVMRLAMQHKLAQKPGEDWATFEKRVMVAAKTKPKKGRGK